jgi:predicted negative regulator of RcsB-dependent stress response
VRVRTAIIATAILSSLLGAVVVYLVFTVPNDVQASVLLREARKEIAAGRNDTARQSLAKIVQQYPRTDAAAAATVALATLGDQERLELERTVLALRQTADAQQKQLADLRQKVDTIAATPPPPPPALAPAPAPAKPTPVKPKKRPVRTQHRKHH